MVFNSYHLSDNASIITTEVPGRNSRQLLEKQDQLEGNNRSYPRAIPIAMERARGAIIEDVDGNCYIDFFAGCGVLNL
jgi:diaminobutyrate-2-oxoglutarate transaminase